MQKILFLCRFLFICLPKGSLVIPIMLMQNLTTLVVQSQNLTHKESETIFMVFRSVLFKTRAVNPEMVPSRAASNKADFQAFPYGGAENYHKAVASPSIQKLCNVHSCVCRDTLTMGCHKCSAPAEPHLVGGQSPVKH